MRKSLQKLFAMATALMLAGFYLQAEASHWQGSELTYTCIAPNVYDVRLKLYRDCTGTSSPSSVNLNLKSQGCNNGRIVQMPQVGGWYIGNLYCPQLGLPQCTSAGMPNYQETNYAATVTFTAAEAQCSNWVMSWSECCRPSVANIPNAQGYSLYTEAFVNLGTPGTTTASINNNSAQFQSQPVPYMPYINGGQPVMLSFMAIDPDGDSLVYSLKDPLTDATTPVPFGSYTLANGNTVNPQDYTQTAFVAVADRPYSATFPMPSYYVDWSLPAPRTATKSFAFDSHNGSVLFMAPVHIPNTAPNQGMNKYAMVVQVDEYRKLGGVAVKVGSARCDMLVTIMDCGPNSNPIVTAPVANGQPLASSATINLRPGTPLNLTFATSDNNPADVLTLESDVMDILPGATFTQTAGNQPTGTITWIPSAGDVRDQIYYFRVRTQDDACPLKGQGVQTFGVRVSNTGGVTGTSKELTTQPGFTAYPNPFGSSLTFRVKQTQPNQHILIYNVLGQQIDQITLKGQLQTEQEVVWQNAAKFPAGQYVARFNNGSGQSLKINKLQ